MKQFLTNVGQKTWLQWMLIAAITAAIYSASLSYGMMHKYDDDSYFNDYRISHLNSETAKQYFSDYYLGMYQPLPVLSFAVVIHIFPDSMPAQRIINLVLHVFNVLLVLIFVRKLTGMPTIAGLTALIFAIHPMHVESVVWISTRSNLMYGAFYLLALIFYLRWQLNERKSSLLLVLIFFALALFSKVSAATLPLVLVLLDWYKSRKITTQLWLNYLMTTAIALVFIYVGVRASGSFGHIQELSTEYSLTDRIFIICNALWIYIFKAFIPVNQSVIYLYPWLKSGHLPVHYYLVGFLLLFILVASVYAGIILWKRNSNKGLLLGIFFFLLTISIVLPLKWSRTIMLAERYTYLPYIGLTLAVMLALAPFYSKWNSSVRSIILAFTILLMVFFTVKSFERTLVWRDPATLFGDVAQNGRTAAEQSMGYYNLGNENLRVGDLENALVNYSTSVEMFPDYAEAYFNRGLTYLYRKEFNEAVGDFSEVIRIKPSFDEGFIERGIAFRALGQFQQALNDFNQVLQRHENGSAYYNRGVLFYFNLNQPAAGCADWEAAQRLGIPQATQMIGTYCNLVP